MRRDRKKINIISCGPCAYSLRSLRETFFVISIDVLNTFAGNHYFPQLAGSFLHWVREARSASDT